MDIECELHTQGYKTVHEADTHPTPVNELWLFDIPRPPKKPVPVSPLKHLSFKQIANYTQKMNKVIFYNDI